MSDRFLLVRPLRKGDLLSDLVTSIDEFGAALNCRFVLTIAETGGDDAPESPAEEEPIANSPEGEPSAPLGPHQIVRRQAGASIFAAHPLYPTNDDLAAVRVEVGKLDRKPGRVLVVNGRYGEVELMASVGNPALTVYSTFDAENNSPEEMIRREIFKQNAPNVRTIAVATFLTLEDNQNVEALILVDPQPGDFEIYSRHLRHDGLLLLVSTNGASPDRPELLADKLTELTPCVLSYYRRAETGHAKQ